MVTTAFSRLLKPLVVAGAVGAAAVPLLTPSPAHAYWRGGVWIGVSPAYVPPPAYYAPPAYYRPPAYYPYYYGPHRSWIPAHWNGYRWVPGHWLWR